MREHHEAWQGRAKAGCDPMRLPNDEPERGVSYIICPLCALLTTLAQPSGLKLNLADALLPTSQSSAPETAVGPRASLDHLSHGHKKTEGGLSGDGELEEGGEMEDWREEETRRMGRAALEGGLGRGSYVVGAQWDEGNMVHAMRRFGGRTVG